MTYTDDTIMDVEARTASDESQTPPGKQKVAQEALDNPVGKGASNLVCEATNHDEDKDAALGAHADLCGAVAVVPPNASAALACNVTRPSSLGIRLDMQFVRSSPKLATLPSGRRRPHSDGKYHHFPRRRYASGREHHHHRRSSASGRENRRDRRRTALVLVQISRA